jgi:methionine salvage enolase-phosphatase E1
VFSTFIHTAQDQKPEQCNFLIIAQSLAVRTRFILLFSAAVVQLKNANKIYLLARSIKRRFANAISAAAAQRAWQER